MAKWVITCSLEYLLSVYERLHSYLLERDILHADEVPCQALKEPGRPARFLTLTVFRNPLHEMPPSSHHRFQPENFINV